MNPEQEQHQQEQLISYQLHSRNDLREWNAIFRKGATSLKIDPHYVKGQDDFILSHDEPTLDNNNNNEPYSTLTDVLEYFQQQQQSPLPTFLLPKTIDIALCFKEAPKTTHHICDSIVQEKNPETIKWLKMVKDFFRKANLVVDELKKRYDITLNFVLDGDVKPCGDCLRQEFQPWKSVWINRDDCSLECYLSDDGYCNRYTILNQPYNMTNWKEMSTPQNHYGKFGLQSNQTLQVWEPDSQQEIQDLIQLYLNGRRQTNQNQMIPSGGGLAFAINIDIAMFQTFTSRFLLLNANANANQVGVGAPPPPPPPPPQGFNQLIQDIDEFDNVYQNATKPNLMYIVDENDEEGDPSKMMILRYTLLANEGGSIRNANVSAYKQQIQRTISFQQQPNFFSMINVGPPEQQQQQEEEDRSEFEPYLQQRFNSTTASYSTSVVRIDDDNGDNNILAFIFVASSDGKVYAGATTTTTMTTANSNTSSSSTTSTLFTGFRLIGLGTHVHASSLTTTTTTTTTSTSTKKQTVLLLVTEGNNCYNSHQHNTRSTPLVCTPQIDPKLHSCPYAIDYSIGTVENWYQWLMLSSSQSSQSSESSSTSTSTSTAKEYEDPSTVITPCNEYILHGTFTGGHHPSGALFPIISATTSTTTSSSSATPPPLRVGIMVAHQPYPLKEESPCGTPIRGEKGIVLSAFASPVVIDAMPTTTTTATATTTPQQSEDLASSSSVSPSAVLLAVVVVVLLMVFVVGQILIRGYHYFKARRAATSSFLTRIEYESVDSTSSSVAAATDREIT